MNNPDAPLPRSARGWPWTAAQRDGIKSWQPDLRKRAAHVASLLNGISETLPAFHGDAQRFAVPFLDAANPLLELDCRRKGCKWQGLAPEAVPEKLTTARRLYDEWHSQFLSRADFQAALREHNADVQKNNREIRKSNEEVVDAHFASLRRELERLETVPEARSEVCGTFITALDIVAASAATRTEDSSILMRWCRVEFVRAAMAIDPIVTERVSQELRQQPRLGIEELVGHALVGLIRHCFEHDNETAQRSSLLLPVCIENGLQLAVMLARGIQSTLMGRSLAFAETTVPITIETLTSDRSHFMILGSDFGP